MGMNLLGPDGLGGPFGVVLADFVGSTACRRSFLGQFGRGKSEKFALPLSYDPID